MRKRLAPLLALLITTLTSLANNINADWTLSVLPASVRIDPSTNRLFDKPYGAAGQSANALLQRNWVFDGKSASLKGARGEYVSFQLVLTRKSDKSLKGIDVAMKPFRNNAASFNVQPELFLEWAVEVKSKSGGYPTASLGRGWYPDALIPFKYIQQGIQNLKVNGWVYPLELPDFNNRIDDQKSLIIWVDQYIPFEKSAAAAGTWSSAISVTIDGTTQSIPVSLEVWDFAVPNENRMKASLQHEGFVSNMTEKQELEVYQLMKRNRVGVMDPTYEPKLTKNGNDVSLDWKDFDKRLKKYFTGEAFTKAHGYEYGPGYGTPIETFLLPFDVYGKHDTRGWPDVGKPNVEKNPANKAAYVNVIRKVRAHIKTMVDPKKTDLTVYLNGLDESYFPEAWDRMKYYGELFRKEYPETSFRVDGSYNDSAMRVIEKAISSWAVHTIDFDKTKFDKYARMGIKQWIYGPMIYESKINSWVGSTTFTDLPLVNDRAISWTTWKYDAHSWLSWGIGAGWKAAWYDTETWKSVNDGGHADGYAEKKLNGNGMLLYSPGIVPNVKGPCPSIRLKAMRDGIQEYEYLRLAAANGIAKDKLDQLVNGLVKQPFGEASMGKIDVWSYDPQKWDETRIILGDMISETLTNKK
ncbi:MAG: DUF4091 domain-containing protein [Chitinophagaceae bacterium]|nr:MAG: DUF4091 domain-containing protein [Chitinophagaceae bacterium]